MKIAINFRDDNIVWQGLICMKLKVGRQLWVQLKKNDKTRTPLKFLNPKLKP